MLLRRVMENLQEQNWLAVILDFLIVVLGVVAAFQLQTWGESRATQQRATQSLHQLYAESEDILAEAVQNFDAATMPVLAAWCCPHACYHLACNCWAI